MDGEVRKEYTLSITRLMRKIDEGIDELEDHDAVDFVSPTIRAALSMQLTQMIDQHFIQDLLPSVYLEDDPLRDNSVIGSSPITKEDLNLFAFMSEEDCPDEL